MHGGFYFGYQWFYSRHSSQDFGGHFQALWFSSNWTIVLLSFWLKAVFAKLNISIFQLQHKKGNLLIDNIPDIVPDSDSLFKKRTASEKNKHGCRTTAQDTDKTRLSIDPSGSEDTVMSPLHLSVISSSSNDLAVRSGRSRHVWCCFASAAQLLPTQAAPAGCLNVCGLTRVFVQSANLII